jgi:hypothetical protein
LAAQVLLALEEVQVLPGLRVQLAQLVHKELLVLQGWVQLELQDLLVQQEQLVSLEAPVQLD